jgi:hypothetical protein
LIFKPRRRSLYTKGKPKKRNAISPLWLILAIPLTLIVLEILAQIALGLAGESFEAYQKKLSQINAYSLKFVTKDQKPIEGLHNQGSLIAQRNVSLGYKLLESQSNDYLKLNEQGFRENESLAIAKPKNEIRIFILGNSTAFGQGSNSNETTISHQLQARLQDRVNLQKKSPERYRPDVFPFFKPLREKAFSLPAKIKEGKYRVINAAVPGYASGNILAQFALEILPYSPDLIIILDGYEDLLLSSNRSETDIPQIETFLGDAKGHFFTALNHSFKQAIEQLYLVQALNYWGLKSTPLVEQKTLVIRENQHTSLADALPKDEAELANRTKRYQEHYKQLIRLSAVQRIPIVIAIQPEITGRINLSAQEQEILKQLDPKYRERVAQYYPKMVESAKQLEKAFPRNVKFLNFYNLNDKFPENTFIDAIHLTEEANREMSEQLYFALTNLASMQIIPQNFVLKND